MNGVAGLLLASQSYFPRRGVTSTLIKTSSNALLLAVGWDIHIAQMGRRALALMIYVVSCEISEEKHEYIDMMCCNMILPTQ